MCQKIANFFSDRKPEHLLVFYFSGYAEKDGSGELYFATKDTRRDKNKIDLSTMVSANYVQLVMDTSKSSEQIVILDASYSGAFIREIKTSIFIQFLILSIKSFSLNEHESRGEENGKNSFINWHSAAAKPNEFRIYVKDIYDFLKLKVQEKAKEFNHDRTPTYEATGEAHNIPFAKVKILDPKKKYRGIFETILERDKGEITRGNRTRLIDAARELRLKAEEVQAIKNEVRNKYKEKLAKLQQYEQALAEAFEGDSSISDDTLRQLRDWQEGLELEDLVLIYKKLANKLQAQEKSEQAIALLKQAIAFHENITDFHINLGDILIQQGKLQDAIASYEKARQLDPKIANPSVGLVSLGNSLKQQGKYKEAIASYDNALEFDAKKAEAYVGKAIALNREEKHPEAIEACKQAIGLKE